MRNPVLLVPFSTNDCFLTVGVMASLVVMVRQFCQASVVEAASSGSKAPETWGVMHKGFGSPGFA